MAYLEIFLYFYSALPINPPACDQAPTTWWDSEADKSLLVGTFKHGYECYSLMRNDPLLCFLARVGPDHHAERPMYDFFFPKVVNLIC